jgi:hypothetical protein
VEGEDVDRPTFAADLERDLGGDLPSRRFEEGEAPLDETGVGRIEKTIEILAVPEEPDIDAPAESGCHPDDGVQRDTVDTSALETPDDRPGDPCSGCDLILGQSPATPERSQRETEPDDVHL